MTRPPVINPGCLPDTVSKFTNKILRLIIQILKPPRFQSVLAESAAPFCRSLKRFSLYAFDRI